MSGCVGSVAAASFHTPDWTRSSDVLLLCPSQQDANTDQAGIPGSQLASARTRCGPPGGIQHAILSGGCFSIWPNPEAVSSLPFPFLFS